MKRRTDVLKVLNTNFTNNSGTYGAELNIFMVLNANHVVTPLVIFIENCSFVENRGCPGSAIAVHQEKSADFRTFALQIIVKNCTFAKNSYPSTFSPNYIQKAKHDLLNTLALYFIQDIIFINCWFEKNYGTPINVYDPQLHLYGKVAFVKNSEMNGGGLYLSGSSLLVLLPNTHVCLFNNSASVYGGGIFVAPMSYGAGHVCFFQIDHSNLSGIIPDSPSDGSKLPMNNSDAVVILDGNTAELAGSAIYGGDVELCKPILGPVSFYHFDNFYLFNKMFKCDGAACINDREDKSLISSDPRKLCPCDAITLVHNCSLPWPTNPGQTFDIPVIAIAQKGGISPGVVLA